MKQDEKKPSIVLVHGAGASPSTGSSGMDAMTEIRACGRSERGGKTATRYAFVFSG